MSYKKIRVEVHCPVECVERVRWAMLKAAHESMMRNYDKVGYSMPKCMVCIYKEKNSDDCYNCLCCSEIGNGSESKYIEAGGESDG